MFNSSTGRPGAPDKDVNTGDPGQKLKEVREQLGLTFRDVEDASLRIAERKGSDEYAIGLSRLSDIEKKNTVPTIYRLYSLCAIYRLDIFEVLRWYGIDVGRIGADAAGVEVAETHLIRFGASGHDAAEMPLTLDPGIDPNKTTFLSRVIQRWGRLPLMLLDGLDAFDGVGAKDRHYGLIGMEDWSMYPILHPGALVMIDESRHKIVSGGWTTEFDRPIYFLQHTHGYACGWCILQGNQLTVCPHPCSERAPVTYEYPTQIEVLGQVTGVAMRIDQIAPGRARS